MPLFVVLHFIMYILYTVSVVHCIDYVCMYVHVYAYVVHCYIATPLSVKELTKRALSDCNPTLLKTQHWLQDLSQKVSKDKICKI